MPEKLFVFRSQRKSTIRLSESSLIKSFFNASESRPNKLKTHHFLAVLGTSGSGKSSLVKAGMFPGLAKGYMGEVGSSWSIAETRPGSQPFHRLSEALLADRAFKRAWGHHASSFLTAELQSGARSLHEILENCPLKKGVRLLILVDQFEEIFRYHQQDDNQAAAFVALLLEASKHNDIFIVLTMRSDFLGEACLFYGLPEAINKGLYLTPRLTRDQLKEAISLPAQLFGGEVESALVNYLLNESSDTSDHLPLLQHALRRLWDTDEDKVLTLEEYKEAGGLQQILNDHLEGTWKNLISAETIVAEQLFRLLTERTRDGQDIRRPVKLSEALLIPGAELASIIHIMEVFSLEGRSFLVSSRRLSMDMPTDTVFDITHESLIRQWDRLQRWVDDEAEKAKAYRALLARANRFDQKKGEVLSGRDLMIEQDWFETKKPNAGWAERYGGGFEKVSHLVKESYRIKKRHLYLKALLGFAAIGGIGFLGYQQYEATIVAEAKAAEAEAKAAEAKAAEAKAAEAEAKAAEAEAKAAADKEMRNAAEDARARFELAQAQAKAELAKAKKQIADNRGRSSASASKSLLMSKTLGSAAIFAQFHDYKRARGVLNDLKKDFEQGEGLSNNLRFQYDMLNAQVDISSGVPSERYGRVDKPLHDVILDKSRKFLWAVGEDGSLFQYQLGDVARKPKKFESGLGRSIQDIAMSPDASMFAIGGDNAKLKIFKWIDAENEPRVVTSKSINGAIKAVAFSPDGNYIATGHVGGSGNVLVRVWALDYLDRDTVTLRQIWAGRHQEQISEGGLVFLSESRLASVSHGGYLRIWKIQDLGGSTDDNPLVEEHLDSPEALGIAFSEEQQLLAVSDNTKITIWKFNGDDGLTLKNTFSTNHTQMIFSLLWIKNQKGVEYLVSSSMDKTLRIWDVDQGVLLRVLEGHEESVGVGGLAYDIDSQQLYSPGKGGKLLGWSSRLPGISLLPLGKIRPRSVAYTPDKKKLIVGMENGGLKLISALPDNAVRSYPIPDSNDTVNSIAVNVEKSLVAVASRNKDDKAKVSGVLTVWEYVDGELVFLKEVGRLEKRFESLVFSKDGTRLYTAGLDGRVGVWDVKDNKGISFSEPITKPDDKNGLQIRSIQISDDGKTLLTARKRDVQLWDVNTDGLLKFPARSESLSVDYDLYGAWFLPANQSKHEGIVLGGRAASVERYKLEGGEIDVGSSQRLSGHTNTVVDVNFIPEGNLLLTGSADATLRAWNLDTNEILFALRLASHSGYPMPFYDFDHYCNDQKCQFAIPLRGKSSEDSGDERFLAVYDFDLK